MTDAILPLYLPLPTSMASTGEVWVEIDKAVARRTMTQWGNCGKLSADASNFYFLEKPLQRSIPLLFEHALRILINSNQLLLGC